MSVVLYRENVAQTAQTMIVTPYMNITSSNVGSEPGSAAKLGLLIVAASDCDIQRNDQFAYHTTYRNYRVTMVVETFAGMIQAHCEVLDHA